MPVPMPCLWPCAVPCGTALLARALSILSFIPPLPPVASCKRAKAQWNRALRGLRLSEFPRAGRANQHPAQKLSIARAHGAMPVWRLPIWHAQMQHRHTNRAPAMTECTVITCARARRWSTPRNPCVRDPRPTPRPMLPQGERWAALRTARKP